MSNKRKESAWQERERKKGTVISPLCTVIWQAKNQDSYKKIEKLSIFLKIVFYSLHYLGILENQNLTKKYTFFDIFPKKKEYK